MSTWENLMSPWDLFRTCIFGKKLMLTRDFFYFYMKFFHVNMRFFPKMNVPKKSHIDIDMHKFHVNMRFLPNMRFFPNMHVWKKIACSEKIACCCLHVDMQFLMSRCVFFLNMQFFSEHACLKKKFMFEKIACWHYKLHVDMQFFACWHAKISCQHASFCRIYNMFGSNCTSTLTTLTYIFKFHVHVDMHSPVCGHTSNNSQLMINRSSKVWWKNLFNGNLATKFCGTSL